MVSITVQLNFDYALSFRFFLLWQPLVETGARSQLAYMAMALNQGKVEVAGQIAHYARYVDWIVTTPLLLLALSWTAMQFIRKDWTLIGFLMSTQVVVITTGLIADLSERGWVRYLWYTCGVAAFLVVLWGIWVPLRAKSKSQGRELAELHDKLTIYFTMLWIGYLRSCSILNKPILSEV